MRPRAPQPQVHDQYSERGWQRFKADSTCRARTTLICSSQRRPQTSRRLRRSARAAAAGPTACRVRLTAGSPGASGVGNSCCAGRSCLVSGLGDDRKRPIQCSPVRPQGKPRRRQASGSARKPAVTVTTALTSRPPAGRYGLWSMSTVKPGRLVMASSPPHSLDPGVRVPLLCN